MIELDHYRRSSREPIDRGVSSRAVFATMVRVVFTSNLQRHLPCSPAQVDGLVIRDVLENVFEYNPRLRGYVLDDQGSVRKHMLIFVDGVPIRDRETLTDTVGDGAEVFVMQALSGG